MKKKIHFWSPTNICRWVLMCKASNQNFNNEVVSNFFFLNYLKSKWFRALPSPSVKINFLAKHNAKQTCSWKEREELVDNVWKFFEKAKVISLVLTIPEKCSSHFLLSTKINIAQRQESANSLCRASALTLYSRRTYVTAESKEAETMMHK